MAARPTALPAHPLRRWPMLGAPATFALALVLFLAFFALRLSDANVGDAEATLFVIPIALIALRFGVRGGLGGALFAFGLVLAWGYLNHVDLHLGGYLTRGAAFFTLGALFGTFVDHRRRLEAEILRHYDASIDLLATADRSGRFTRVNRAWQRTLGHAPEAMRTRPFIDFVHPDDREATIAEATRLARGAHESVGFRNRCRAADGSYRWLEWSASASAGDGVIHVVARDISAKHDAEQQLADNAKWLETRVAERTLELEDARAETLHRLAIAAEYRDDETFEHAGRVGATAAGVAAGLGLGAEEVKLLREAAPLHDVGKLAIPDRILLKPGRLDPQEWELMKTHAELGADLLSGSSSPVLQMAAVIAATHHERFDGTGYPKGLAGHEIPLVGRIVAVADVFDALTHDRPYKKATPTDRAIAEMRRVAGSQLDPRVVEAFLATLGDRAVAEPEHHERAAQRVARTGPALRPSRPAQYA
jgi:PAS domain S-box-containing protein